MGQINRQEFDGSAIEKSLTPRELDVLQLMVRGSDNGQIAAELTLSPKTVKWYARQIYQKLNVHDRQGAVSRARKIFHNEKGKRDPLRLPGQPDQIIGRQIELDFVQQIFNQASSRILSIVGPGGVGKTQLALTAAKIAQQKDVFPDGVFLASLTGIYDLNHFEIAIAGALQIHFEIGVRHRSPRQQLLEFLKNKHLLLILDNLEPWDAGRNLILTLNQAAGSLFQIITSRERLQIHEEQILPLAGLTYAPKTEFAGTNPKQIESYPAVALFISRAKKVDPTFKPSSADLDHINNICRLLDGLPLGIEMAAAWIDKLPLVNIVTELSKSLDLLKVDLADKPHRHRTLRAVFDTSWGRLSPREQRVLARLSIFQKGFTLQAAQKVADANLTDLTVLINKSLLRLNLDLQWYELHEIVRHYAKDQQLKAKSQSKLVEITPQLQDLHSKYYCEAIAACLDDLRGHQQSTILHRIEEDIGNIRTAWLYALKTGDLNRLGQGLDAMGLFCELRGRYEEGLALFQPLAEMTVSRAGGAGEKPYLWVCGLLWVSVFQRMLGQQKKARLTIRQVDDLIKRTPSETYEKVAAFYHLQRGHIDLNVDLIEARECYLLSLEMSQKNEDSWGEAAAYAGLGKVSQQLGQLDQADGYWQRCLFLREDIGDGIGQVATSIGLCELSRYRSQFSAANNYAARAVTLSRSLHNSLVEAESVEQLGISTFYTGNFNEALGLLHKALAYYNRLAATLNHPNIFFRVALSYASLGNYQQTVTYARRGIKDQNGAHKSTSVLIYLILSNIHLVKNELHQAEQKIKKGLAMSNDDKQIDVVNLKCYQATILARQGHSWKANHLLANALMTAVEKQNFFGVINALFNFVLIETGRNNWENAADVWHILRDKQPWTNFSRMALVRDLLGADLHELNRRIDAMNLDPFPADQRDRFDIWPSAARLIELIR